MDEREVQLKKMIDEVSCRLAESKSRSSDLKRKLQTEDTKAIGLKLSKDSLEELLRKYKSSLPDSPERKDNEKKIDEDFLLRLPILLRKV